MKNKILVVGSGNIGITTLTKLAINTDVYVAQTNQFEPEPIRYIARPPLIENQINYDKYGKPLLNEGSKFHK